MLCRSEVVLSKSRMTHLEHLFQKLINFHTPSGIEYRGLYKKIIMETSFFIQITWSYIQINIK